MGEFEDYLNALLGMSCLLSFISAWCDQPRDQQADMAPCCYQESRAAMPHSRDVGEKKKNQVQEKGTRKNESGGTHREPTEKD